MDLQRTNLSGIAILLVACANILDYHDGTLSNVAGIAGSTSAGAMGGMWVGRSDGSPGGGENGGLAAYPLGQNGLAGQQILALGGNATATSPSNGDAMPGAGSGSQTAMATSALSATAGTSAASLQSAGGSLGGTTASASAIQVDSTSTAVVLVAGSGSGGTKNDATAIGGNISVGSTQGSAAASGSTTGSSPPGGSTMGGATLRGPAVGGRTAAGASTGSLELGGSAAGGATTGSLASGGSPIGGAMGSGGSAMGGAIVSGGAAMGGSAPGSTTAGGGETAGHTSGGAASGGTFARGGQGTGCVGGYEAISSGSSQLCVANMIDIAPPVLVNSYKIDMTEVTQGQYLSWLSAGPIAPATTHPSCSANASLAPSSACSSSPYLCVTNCEHHPMVCVDWCDAYAYCSAVGKRLCGAITGGANDYTYNDNPTTSQWYRACSSGGLNTYPYGSTYSSSTCNGSGFSHGAGLTTLEVGFATNCVSTATGFTGAFDLSGNVWEWEDSCESAGATAHCRLRGGAFYDTSSSLACGYGSGSTRDKVDYDIGFRCCSL